MHDFEVTHQDLHREPSDALRELIGGDRDVEAFWQDVKTNVEAGRVRMVFVADAIPTEVQRVIEFLNDQMNPAEVLGIEVKQYLGQDTDVRTLVPRKVGQTTRAQERKRARSGSGPKVEWSEEALLETLRRGKEPEAAAVARRLIDGLHARGLQSGFMGGPKVGAQWFQIEAASATVRFVYVHSDGLLGLAFDRVSRTMPFASFEARREIADCFERVGGVTIPDDRLDRGTSIRLRDLQDEEATRTFIDAVGAFQARLLRDSASYGDGGAPHATG